MDKLQTRVDGMLHNEVNITALNKAVEKLQNDVEKLKDKQRHLLMELMIETAIVLLLVLNGNIIEHTYKVVWLTALNPVA